MATALRHICTKTLLRVYALSTTVLHCRHTGYENNDNHVVFKSNHKKASKKTRETNRKGRTLQDQRKSCRSSTQGACKADEMNELKKLSIRLIVTLSINRVRL